MFGMQPLSAFFGNKPIELAPGTVAPAEPEKAMTVSADTRAPRPAAIVQGGEAYTPTMAEAARMEPAIKCPKCGSLVCGLDDAVAEFTLPDLPAELNRHKYRVENCGCWVTQEWAGALNAEITNRQGGGDPKTVVEMTKAQRRTLYKRLEKKLGEWMDLARVSPTPELQAKYRAWTEAVIAVMQYVAEPPQAAGHQAISGHQTFIGHQAAPVGHQGEINPDWAPHGVQPNLAAAAKKLEAKGYQAPLYKRHGPTKIQSQPKPLLGEPRPEYVRGVYDRLKGLDWVPAIAGAFPNLIRHGDRLSMRELLIQNLEHHVAAGVELHQGVHKLINYLFGVTIDQPILGPTAMPTVTVAEPVRGPLPTSPLPATPAVQKESNRFRKRKRKISKGLLDAVADENEPERAKE